VAHVVRYVSALFGQDQISEQEGISDAAIRRALQSISLAKLRKTRLLDALLELARHDDELDVSQQTDETILLAADADDLIEIALRDND
jgi:hypothetical protein